jgi:LAO/AO transport system kinase
VTRTELKASERALIEAFQAGEIRALARAITWVENGRPGFQRLLSALHGRIGRAHRIGITGPPGAGKSTLIRTLALELRKGGQRVGVIAVDPSSPFTGGALLGDRIRMAESATDEGVFIRSMASRGSFGGLATTTREVADLLDAFGFDRVIVETVGVGQSELEIAGAADTTAVGSETAPAGGASGEPKPWSVEVVKTVAESGEGVERLLETVDRHRAWLVASGEMERRRRERLVERVRAVVERSLRARAWNDGGRAALEAARADLEAGRRSPYDVADEILAGLK